MTLRLKQFYKTLVEYVQFLYSSQNPTPHSHMKELNLQSIKQLTFRFSGKVKMF